MSLVPLNRNPSARDLLVFALAWLLLLGAAGLRLWSKGRPGVALVLGMLAVAMPAAGLLSPRVVRLGFIGLSLATYPIGYVISKVVLGVVYFAVLTPVGLTMRLLGHDSMGRKFDPGRQSYWEKRPGPRPPEHYFRQD